MSDDMSDFDKFFCFSSAMVRCGGTGNAEAKEWRLGFREKTKKIFKIAHII